MRATARGSAVLTLLPLPEQFLDRARQSRLEVDQLRPARRHDDPDHAVVLERTQRRHPKLCRLAAAVAEPHAQDVLLALQVDPDRGIDGPVGDLAVRTFTLIASRTTAA